MHRLQPGVERKSGNVRWKAAGATAVALGLFPVAARGHDGYVTTYSHHMEPGELEIMVMVDFTSPSKPRKEDDGQKDYFSQMLEVEYYPTSQLALEFMLEGFEDVGNGDGRFTGFRYEARYRLFEDKVPLNPTLYAEYEDLDPRTRYKMEVSGWVVPPYPVAGEEEPDRERIMETRLILSQDIEDWNVAFNWINESDLNAGDTAFGYAVGVLYRLPHASAACHNLPSPAGGTTAPEDHPPHAEAAAIRVASIGFEFWGALGDTIAFGLRPANQEHYFQPSIMFHVGEQAMLTLGFGIGLTDSSDNLVRLMWGWEF